MKYLFLSVLISSLLVTIATPSPAVAEGNVPPGRPFLELLLIVKSLEKRVAEPEKENSALPTGQDKETVDRTADGAPLQPSVVNGVSDASTASSVSGQTGNEPSGYGPSTLGGYHPVASTRYETIPALP